MTTKTDEVLATALQIALDTAKATGTFVVEQAPDVVQQLVLYKTVEYTVWSVIPAVGAVCLSCKAVQLYRKAAEKVKKSSSNFTTVDDFSEFWFSMLSGSASVILSLIAATHITWLLKITLAPKVWLLEYAASLVK